MVVIDGRQLTCAQVAAVARERAPVEVAPGVRERVAAARERAVASAGRRPVYGRTTGVGANRDVAVADPAAHALNLLRSHATAAGPPVDPEAVRGMLVVRLNQLAAGGSGVGPRAVDALQALLREGVLPEVRREGGIGMGDLAALAGTALTMLGERPGAGAAPASDGSRLIEPGDVLPFLSSSALTIAEAALACVDVARLARAAVVVAALSARALRANREAFDPLVEEITPFPGARAVCRWMRELLPDDRDRGGPARLQDFVALRCVPQVQGPVLDAVEGLDDVVRRLANVAAENPVVRPDAPDVVHHGGFHTAYLGLALDAATLAVAQSGASVLGRLAHLLEPLTPDGPAFLADEVPGSSGAMGLEFVAASALGALRALAVPAGLQTVTLSRGVEDDASFASLSARQARDAVPRYATLLACELVAGVRSLRLQDAADVGPAAAPRMADALALCRDLPESPADRDLSPDLDLATALLPALGALLA
jgi:histidine ammonia-lyase